MTTNRLLPIFWCREGMELIGQTQCSSEIYQASDIENAVFQALKKELSLLDSLYGDIKKEEQSLKEASRKASRRKTLMEQELKNLKGEKMRMYEEYAAGTLSLDNYKNKKQECDRKIAEVQDKNRTIQSGRICQERCSRDGTRSSRTGRKFPARHETYGKHGVGLHRKCLCA